MAGRSMRRSFGRAPQPPQRLPISERGCHPGMKSTCESEPNSRTGGGSKQRRNAHDAGATTLLASSLSRKGRSAWSGPRLFTLPSVQRRISPDVSDPLLRLGLGCGRWLRRQLQHGRLLTLDEFGQEHGLPIRKLERVMVHPRLVLVDLPKDRRLVGHPARTQAEESGCGACNVAGKRKLRSRKHAHCRGDIFLGGKSARTGTKVARGELVADSGSTPLHIVQAVVAHGEDSSFKPPVRPLPYSNQQRCQSCGRGEKNGYAACDVALASITSSNVLSPVRGALTSTAILPGGCRLVRINSCACGIRVQGKTSLMQGSMRRSSTNWFAAEACLRWAKCEPCMRFCRIQT